MATAATLEDSSLRYGRTAIAFHWLIAALIVLNILLGFFHEDFADPLGRSLLRFHKATGMTILALSLARLVWRLLHRPPPSDRSLARWETMLAHATHWIFYLLMIALPVTGWMLTSANKRATSWFGLFDIPPLPVTGGKAAAAVYGDRHEILAWVIVALLVLHVGGALWHHLRGQRQIVARIAPWVGRRRI
jgi:cytochrome b561